MPRLSNLLAQANLTPLHLVGDVTRDVAMITADSRRVEPGALFVAIPGTAQDGHHFIEDAVTRGAAAVVSALPMPAWHYPATWVQLPDARSALSKLAAAFYTRQPEHMLAVTGTDGKTSTAEFTRQLATRLGYQAASIGTLGLRSDHRERDAAYPAQNTSPEPVLLHRTLELLATDGVSVVAMEASSHGLDQKRLEGVHFKAAAFTNLTRDHLDYHGTLEAYAAAKTRLFSELLPASGTAVLNRDDAHYGALEAVCRTRGITLHSFGTHAQADYRIVSLTPHAGGLDATLSIGGTTHEISLPLYGGFQLFNMLAAVGLLGAIDIPAASLIGMLPQMHGAPGRLEKIATTRHGAPIFVDYAHTPAALENILKTLRAHTQAKLHVVFGCGGNRDAGKRPEMGWVANRYADEVIVTDDNPRLEDPALIRAAILKEVPKAEEIPDRATAIRTAVRQLAAGDVLVVAGKGHEQTQTIGAEALPFSDAEQIHAAVRNL